MEFVEDHFPVSQLLHVVELVNEYVPRKQSVQIVADGIAENLPGLHPWHCFVVLLKYVPGWQVSQVDDAVFLVNEFSPHDTHANEPTRFV